LRLFPVLHPRRANKYLAAILPVWQILFFRSLTIVIGSLVFGRRALLRRRWRRR